MTDERPDTDRTDPAGTPSPGPDNLIDKPATPGGDDPSAPTAVSGAYESDEADQERGKAVKPGN
jgi:hypothetical protein